MASTKARYKKKAKRQYTKLVIDLVLWLVIISTLGGLYINYKNGASADSIAIACWEGLKYIIPSYCCKSYFETKEEKNRKEDDLEC